jgi:hypothetical protein
MSSTYIEQRVLYILEREQEELSSPLSSGMVVNVINSCTSFGFQASDA